MTSFDLGKLSCSRLPRCKAITCCSASKQTVPQSTRRQGLIMVSSILASQIATPMGAVLAETECSDDPAACLGEVNNTLNACSLSTDSCVSTFNDDELHFAAPWEFDIPRDDAIQLLVDVATGKKLVSGRLIDEPFGVSRGEIATYIVKGVAAVIQNGEMPERPQRKKQEKSEKFYGELSDRHTTSNGGEYVRLVLYPDGTERDQVDPVNIIDAEFLFLPEDNIVDIRAVSRVQPSPDSRGELGLSFTQGVIVDKNIAKRRLEQLRRALDWQLAPVLTDFDPKFNPEVPQIVERLFEPFSERNKFQPSGEPYPID